MDTVFTVRKEDLSRLNPGEATELFRRLLCAEATRNGLALTNVHISSRINVPDGGVDARIEGSVTTSPVGLYEVGITTYQIKASDSFKPWQVSEIKNEFFGGKNAAIDNLGPSIRDCLNENGKYILICFRQDLNDLERQQTITNMRDSLRFCGYDNPKVDVWSQNNLRSFLEQYPSLILDLRGLGNKRFLTHKMWSQQDDMRKDFKVGEKQNHLISGIQSEIRKNDEAVHVRVLGEAGVGKTKVVLESTRESDLEPLVIYTSANQFRDRNLMNELQKSDNNFSVILVIDECDPESRAYIWNNLKHKGPRIKIISIYNDFESTTGNIVPIKAPPLLDEQIKNILLDYIATADQADRWVEYCGGSPRVAHLLGENLKNNPDDLLKSPDTVNVWDRIIAGGDDQSCTDVQERIFVLRYLALFKRFGFSSKVAEESKAIAELIQKENPQIPATKFHEIVQLLRRRKILQGENTLYISPKLLHIKLWRDWWEMYGAMFDINKFFTGLPPKLLDWFNEMLVYASESKAASKVVNELLGEDGPFADGSLLSSKPGSNFFLALSEAEPDSALWLLKNTVGKWDRNQLLNFGRGRREVIWALEGMAQWREMFTDAATLLLALGEAENETYANNASGVFAGLFSPAPGRVAPTEASPEERLPVLQEALFSDSQEKRKLGMYACTEALKTRDFTKMLRPGWQSLRKQPRLWEPKTYGEMFDWYRKVWALLLKRMETLPDDEKQQAADILINQSRGIITIGSLSGMVIDTLSELATKPFVSRKKLLGHVNKILHYDSKELPQETKEKLENLNLQLTGEGYGSLLKRYVGMSFLEDHFDETGKRSKKIEEQIRQLASQARSEEELLEPELYWLTTTEAQSGYAFGYELGVRDEGFTLLSRLLDAQRATRSNISVGFLGGYFRALYERDEGLWETNLDSLIPDQVLNTWIPELTWRSGISHRSASRVLQLAKDSIIGVEHLQIYLFGSRASEMPEEVFVNWINFLLESTDVRAIRLAVELVYIYYILDKVKKELPERLIYRLLTHENLFERKTLDKSESRIQFAWTNTGKRFVEQHPKVGLGLASKMLEHFGQEGTITEGFYSETEELLNKIAKQCPKEVWQLVAKYLGPPADSRAFHITTWLKGGEFSHAKEGALHIFPKSDIWEWVEKDRNTRAPYLASFVPKDLLKGKESSKIGRAHV